MATLTYDPTPADQPEFTPEEQDSIAVGEQLEQQQNQLLAGKYENAEQLEKAYVELQRKLGETKEEEEPQPEDEQETEQVEEEQQPEEEEEQTEGLVMTTEDVEYLHNMVGGTEQYKEMVTWASENLSQQEVQAYDAVMDLDNPYAAYFAVRALSNSYKDAVGYEGKMLTGKASATPVDTFRSQAEVVQAMSDPRYDNDPAYRNDVYLKLERSNLEF